MLDSHHLQTILKRLKYELRNIAYRNQYLIEYINSITVFTNIYVYILTSNNIEENLYHYTSTRLF